MILRTALIALIALAPSLVDAHVITVEDEWRDPAKPAPRGDAMLQAAMLTRHNAARAEAGAPPLAWDDALAADARAYAATLAREASFEHEDQDAEGENLFMGTRGAYRYDEMAGMWAGERTEFSPGVFPEVSRTGDWGDVGHYTQMIWAGTQRVGCAVAANADDDYLVCRYAPAGNVMGERIGRPRPMQTAAR